MPDEDPHTGTAIAGGIAAVLVGLLGIAFALGFLLAFL
jgi:hypothetical protein